MTRFGVSIAYYGGAPWPIAILSRQLAMNGVKLLDIRGCAYPEMARAEQTRQALLSDCETVVFVDSWVGTDLTELEWLVMRSEQTGGIVSSCDAEYMLSFCALPVAALRKIVEAEDRRYANSPVDLMFRRDGAELADKAPASPLASPWNRDGSSLLPGAYLTESEAFARRARQAGVSITFETRSFVFNRPRIQTRVVNLDKEVRPDSAGSNFALCIPSFGPLDLDQMGHAFALERAGMAVIEINGCSWIDMARSWLTERALASGRGVFFLDHDIIFHPNDVLRLCQEALEKDAVIAGAYCMRKSGKHLIGALDVEPGPVKFFEKGSILPAFYTGLGFAAIPRSILEAIKLSSLHTDLLGSLRPWYALDCSTGFYAGEDVSFCNRVHDLTVVQQGPEEWKMTHSGRAARVYIDTRVRIAHRGVYDYGLEDAGIVVPRFSTLTSMLTTSRAEAREFLVSNLPAEKQLEQLSFASDDEEFGEELAKIEKVEEDEPTTVDELVKGIT